MLLHRPQHRQEAQRGHDRAMRHRLRSPLRRPHRQQILQHIRVQGILQPRRLCLLPNPERRAPGADGGEEGDQDPRCGDMRGCRAHRVTPVRRRHRVHHGQRGEFIFIIVCAIRD